MKVIEEGYLIQREINGDVNYLHPNATQLFHTKRYPEKEIEWKVKSGLWSSAKVVKAQVVVDEGD